MYIYVSNRNIHIHSNGYTVGDVVLHRLLADMDKRLFRVTLVATALITDAVTKNIASEVHNIINIPLDTRAAWKSIDQLNLDIVLFPDWQPFPDQQALLFQSRRIAPVQICIFVRGSSCSSGVSNFNCICNCTSKFFA